MNRVFCIFSLLYLFNLNIAFAQQVAGPDRPHIFDAYHSSDGYTMSIWVNLETKTSSWWFKNPEGKKHQLKYDVSIYEHDGFTIILFKRDGKLKDVVTISPNGSAQWGPTKLTVKDPY